MTKEEFLAICDRVFKEYGFQKHKTSYYLDLGSDIVGSIHFQGSAYGKAMYINCGFSLKNYNEHLPYPKYRDTNMDWRMAVPGKEKLSRRPDTYDYLTDCIKYDYYNPEELESNIKSALDTWVIPAIRYGMAYIMAHDKYYRVMLIEARNLHTLPDEFNV